MWGVGCAELHGHGGLRNDGVCGWLRERCVEKRKHQALLSAKRPMTRDVPTGDQEVPSLYVSRCCVVWKEQAKQARAGDCPKNGRGSVRDVCIAEGAHNVAKRQIAKREVCEERKSSIREGRGDCRWLSEGVLGFCVKSRQGRR